MDAQEEVLFTSRIHPKILFLNGVIQLGLLVALVLVMTYYPERAGGALVQRWAPWLLGLVLLGLEMHFVAVPVLRWWFRRFTITNYMVKDEWGIFWKNSREIDLHRIVSITMSKGLLDQIFCCGTLNFLDAASQESRGPSRPLSRGASSGISFHDIPKVAHVKQLLETARRS